jgi:peptidoglycan hydrolase CwlO-like protein
MKIKLFLLFFFIASVGASVLFFIKPKTAQADNYCKKENMCSDSDCLQKLVDECQEQIEKANNKEATLASEIEYADNQINLTELKIQSTNKRIAEKEASINKLAGDIDDISNRMEGLSKSIVFQGNVLNERMRARYKSIETSPIIIILGAGSLNKIVQRTEYLKIMELQDHKIITQMNKTKNDYAEQKKLYEETKSKEEDLQAQIIVEKNNLVGYQNDLANQRAKKQELLADTQNDEAKYQKLLDEAQKQLAEFRGFTSSAGGGVIGANGFGKGKEGLLLTKRLQMGLPKNRTLQRYYY